ncbi:MAG: hypothetical protein HKO01_07890 [Flaviramulus sp.]|nr:hypothetical protein [Flaviramulus sp.]NNC50436.1 hypothetical protein [Flaviramulus sp.]
MKSILINNFQKIVKLLSFNSDDMAGYEMDTFRLQQMEPSLIEKQDYMLNKNLKNLEFLSQLEFEITDDELRFFPQDFIQNLETDKLISKINTIKNAGSLKVNAA